jgi:hypothetical protein
MKRKKKKRSIPCFTFTLETIQITQKALKLFEQSLQRVDHQRPKVAFAEETMNQVKGKLEAMSTSVGLMCLTTFDYNEKIVIATAIQFYTLDLLSAPFHSQREKELQKCRQIARFAQDNLKLEQRRTTQD